jgi:hypothetical protein
MDTNELDLVRDMEFFCAAFRLLGEQRAHVDTRAHDAVIACPDVWHLARAAAEVEDTGPRLKEQCRAERSEFYGCERVVDAMSAFSNVEDLSYISSISPANLKVRRSWAVIFSDEAR